MIFRLSGKELGKSIVMCPLYYSAGVRLHLMPGSRDEEPFDYDNGGGATVRPRLGAPLQRSTLEPAFHNYTNQPASGITSQARLLWPSTAYDPF